MNVVEQHPEAAQQVLHGAIQVGAGQHGMAEQREAAHLHAAAVEAEKLVIHVHTNHAMSHGPEHDVVVERAVASAPIATHEGTAMHEDQHRSRRAGFDRREDIQQVTRVRTVGL